VVLGFALPFELQMGQFWKFKRPICRAMLTKFLLVIIFAFAKITPSASPSAKTSYTRGRYTKYFAD
jgi:hypothetical protein